MFSFLQYHFHFCTLTEQENVNLFVDQTRLLSISIDATQNLIFLLGRIENIDEKENDCNQQIVLFPQCFQKFHSPGMLKVRTVCQRVKCQLKTELSDSLWLYHILRYLCSTRSPLHSLETDCVLPQ